MAASLFNAPELVLTEQESKNFATALEAVQRHYNVQITQKSLDHIQFFAAIGSIYGPRLAAIGMRKRNERAKKPAPQPQAPRPSNVYPIRPDTIRPGGSVSPQAAEVAVDAEGDPTQSGPMGGGGASRPMTEAEKLFAQTPPEML